MFVLLLVVLCLFVPVRTQTSLFNVLLLHEGGQFAKDLPIDSSLTPASNLAAANRAIDPSNRFALPPFKCPLVRSLAASNTDQPTDTRDHHLPSNVHRRGLMR